MHYRINAGFIPPEHWVHDPVEGGGRILGRGLPLRRPAPVPGRRAADARLRRVDRRRLALPRRRQRRAHAALRRRLGRHASSTPRWATRALGKEYLEVYGEGGVAILDDFRTLLLARDGKQRAHEVGEPGQGLRDGDEALRRGGDARRRRCRSPSSSSSATTRATLAARRVAAQRRARRRLDRDGRRSRHPGREPVLRARDGRAGRALPRLRKAADRARPPR